MTGIRIQAPNPLADIYLHRPVEPHFGIFIQRCFDQFGIDTHLLRRLIQFLDDFSDAFDSFGHVRYNENVGPFRFDDDPLLLLIAPPSAA